jgi:hypothetical protein
MLVYKAKDFLAGNYFFLTKVYMFQKMVQVGDS